MDHLTKYKKLKSTLLYFLLGREYYRAADALEFFSKYHTGLRKDGVTPEYQHQIEIAHYVRSILSSISHPEDTIITILGHDSTEDHGVPLSIIRDRFGDRVAHSINLLDKNGKESQAYFSAIAEDEIASIGKGADRIHNVQTMVGVFSLEKQARYLNEVDEYFLPMLKTARRRFPRQEAAYENMKHMLVSQSALIRLLLTNHLTPT